MRAKNSARFAGVAALALIVAQPSWLLGDASLRAPAPPSGAQAISAARRLWSAVRARDRDRIAAAAGAQVRMWAALAELPVLDNYEADVDRARFAERMTTLELGRAPAEDWHRLAEPPLTAPPGTVWVGASVQSSEGVGEGHGARIGELAFGVRLVGGRALVVAFDATYAESRLIFSR